MAVIRQSIANLSFSAYVLCNAGIFYGIFLSVSVRLPGVFTNRLHYLNYLMGVAPEGTTTMPNMESQYGALSMKDLVEVSMM